MALTVDQLYELILNRQADPGGRQFWQEYTSSRGTPGIDPEELDAFISGAQSAGERVNSSGTQQVLGMLSGPVASADNPPSPNDFVPAFDPTNNPGIIYAPQTRDVDQGVAAQTDYSIINPRTGQLENVSPASDFIPGAPANQFVVSSGQGVFEKDGKRYQPVNLVTVDASGNVTPSGMFNIEQNKPSNFQRIGTAIATAVAAAVMGPAVGAALGLSGTAATVVGNAIVNGTTTGIITGDAERAALAALSSAAGSYISSSGIISDTLESIGLTDVADFLDTNLVTKSVSDATSNGTLSSVVDAANNVITTIGKNIGVNTVSDAIAATSSGLLSSTAADGIQTVKTTATKTDVEVNPVDIGTAITSSTLEPNTDLDTTSEIDNKLETDEDKTTEDYRVDITGDKTDTTLTGGDAAAAMAASVAAANATDNYVDDFSEIDNKLEMDEESSIADKLKKLGLGGLLTDLFKTGIDATVLNQLENMTAGKAEDVRKAFEGAAKDVQFTPYTVTTGFGSTAFGTDAAGKPTATATASPEYQALRDQALAQAGTALGAINPADSAQALYDRARLLADPTDRRQQEQLLSSLGARGLLGIGRNLPTVGGTTAAVNPFVESLLSAQRTADANLALQSQQFGTQEAMRQQQLAQALQGQGMAVDTATQGLFAPSLSFGTQAATTAGQSADRALRATQLGETLATTYDLANLDARTQLLKAQAEAAKGVTSNVLPKFLDLFGL